MADEIERMLNLLEEAEQEWPDEPVIDRGGWLRLASLAEVNGLPSAAAGCLAAAGEWPDHRGWMNLPEDFDSRINEIGERHGFPSISKHLNACVSLSLLTRTLPANVVASEGVIHAEQGATSWRDFRRKIPGWLSRVKEGELDFLYLLALELHGDETSFTAASVAGVRERLTALIMKLESIIASGVHRDIGPERDELGIILAGMMKIMGPNGGRHSHGSRRRECVRAAKAFWEQQFDRNATVSFVPDPVVSPNSPFARWFCDVMNYVDEWSAVTCRDVLRTDNGRQ